MIKFYGYDKCSTCRKAKKYLNSKKAKFADIDITVNPPSKTLLKSILKSGNYSLKDLFNKSGQLYRDFDIKSKIAKMTEAQAFSLLAKHGKLVKRPLITDGKKHTIGFDEKVIKKVWK